MKGVVAALFLGFTAQAQTVLEPPVIPVGLDAYRQWEKWPLQRMGVRAYMRSTYDRTGGNRSADASHFLYQIADDNNVTLDVEGQGILYFARYNHWHGSPWRYVVDGTESIVQESSSADPTKPVSGSVFLPQELFPSPLAWTWSATKGADLMWVPIPFEKSFRMGYSRTRYGTGYYIYHLYAPGTKLSQPIQSWDGKTPPGKDVLELIARSGSDLSPKTSLETNGTLPEVAFRTGYQLASLKGAGMVRKIGLTISKDQAIALGRARLRITWDGRSDPSVDAPVALFFGAGTLYNREEREYLVKAFPMNIRYANDRVELACYFPMPFFKSAKFELIGPEADSLKNLSWTIRTEPLPFAPEHAGYFHATYRDHARAQRGHDLLLLDTDGVEGKKDWSGSFVGMSWIFSDRAVLNTLEGDPRFFFDDSETPQAYGTGTEEWGGGGDYWGGLNMTLPFAGHPVGARNVAEAKNEEDKIESAYRFLLADLMPFGRRAVIRLEHGGINDSVEHYQTITYWYGASVATLVKTDMLKIADRESESGHNYYSPHASDPYEMTSRYELGPDTIVALAQEENPVAHPGSYAEYEFEAEAAKTYYIWVRGANLDGNNLSDAFWMQFDEDIGTTRMAASYSHEKGFGNWLDVHPASTYAWSSALPQEPPRTITFKEGGKHKLRIQARHGGHNLDQIWLSSSQATRPKEGTRAAAAPGEIVLNAVKAQRHGGNLIILEDTRAGTGNVLHIGNNRGSNLEIYPAHADRGRWTEGASEFTMRIDPKNFGVMLRRKLDYSFPNQRAEVHVAEAGKEQSETDWKPAGIWYLAGSNTCVYSDPREELGATEHNIITSNRAFRDDEFLLPLDLTRGRSAIRIRVKFTPVQRPLFPGHPIPKLAWSEIRYDAYCYILPQSTQLD
jgi:hypothetical protein